MGGPKPADNMFEKFGQRRPLNWQAEPEGAPVALSIIVDAVRSTRFVPHGEVPVNGGRAPVRRRHDTARAGARQDDTGQLWTYVWRTYVRDDKPFGSASPPAAIFHYSCNRQGEDPQAHLVSYAGILQADAFDGCNKFYLPDRKPGRSEKPRAGPPLRAQLIRRFAAAIILWRAYDSRITARIRQQGGRAHIRHDGAHAR
jgi:hypothetical protein